MGRSTKLSVNESTESYRPVKLRLDGSASPREENTKEHKTSNRNLLTHTL